VARVVIKVLQTAEILYLGLLHLLVVGMGAQQAMVARVVLAVAEVTIMVTLLELLGLAALQHLDKVVLVVQDQIQVNILDLGLRVVAVALVVLAALQ
jgi:hypothetical protein